MELCDDLQLPPAVYDGFVLLSARWKWLNMRQQVGKVYHLRGTHPESQVHLCVHAIPGPNNKAAWEVWTRKLSWSVTDAEDPGEVKLACSGFLTSERMGRHALAAVQESIPPEGVFSTFATLIDAFTLDAQVVVDPTERGCWTLAFEYNTSRYLLSVRLAMDEEELKERARTFRVTGPPPFTADEVPPTESQEDTLMRVAAWPRWELHLYGSRRYDEEKKAWVHSGNVPKFQYTGEKIAYLKAWIDSIYEAFPLIPDKEESSSSDDDMIVPTRDEFERMRNRQISFDPTRILLRDDEDREVRRRRHMTTSTVTIEEIKEIDGMDIDDLQ